METGHLCETIIKFQKYINLSQFGQNLQPYRIRSLGAGSWSMMFCIVRWKVLHIACLFHLGLCKWKVSFHRAVILFVHCTGIPVPSPLSNFTNICRVVLWRLPSDIWKWYIIDFPKKSPKIWITIVRNFIFKNRSIWRHRCAPFT